LQCNNYLSSSIPSDKDQKLEPSIPPLIPSTSKKTSGVIVDKAESVKKALTLNQIKENSSKEKLDIFKSLKKTTLKNPIPM